MGAERDAMPWDQERSTAIVVSKPKGNGAAAPTIRVAVRELTIEFDDEDARTEMR